jgi:hypothetical protein
MERRDGATGRGRARKGSRRILGFLALAPVLTLAACERDIFDIDVDLSPHAYTADFGPPMGEIPTVTCTAAAPGVCGAVPVVDIASMNDGPADVSVAVGCDAPSGRCYAQATARIGFEVNVLMDEAFITRVERKATTLVRMLDIAYTLPKNTLTIDVPKVDVFVGPAGSHSEKDAGVVLVDSIPLIAAGTTFTERRHLTLADGSPARALLETSIQAREPFVFLVVTAPRLEAGEPMPGGAFEIVLYPKVRFGLPR